MPPFSGFSDFQDCMDTMMQKGNDEESAKKICGKMQSDAETAKVATIQPVSFDSAQKDKMFIKAFVLNKDTNLNDWGVTTASLEDRINSFIGKPLVLTSNFDHPNFQDQSITHALEYQELFRIGNIIDITKSTNQSDPNYGSYYAIIEITDPAAKEAFSMGEMPLYVSPAIAKLTESEPEDQISNWVGIHLAVVDNPAYRVQKAQITSRCAGDKQQCLLQLRKAHVEKYGPNNCGFCIKAALLSKAKPIEIHVTGNESKEELKALAEVAIARRIKLNEELQAARAKEKEVYGKNFDTAEKVVDKPWNAATIEKKATEQKTNSSLDSKNEKTKVVMTDPTGQPNPNNNNSSSATPAPEQTLNDQPKTIDQGEWLNAEVAKLKAENAILSSTNAQLKSQNEALLTENNNIKQAYRKDRIATIVNSVAHVIPSEEERNKQIETFLNANLTPEQVQDIYKTVIPVTTQATTKTASVSYDAKVPIRSASFTPKEENDTSWMRIADGTVRRTGNNGGVQ